MCETARRRRGSLRKLQAPDSFLSSSILCNNNRNSFGCVAMNLVSVSPHYRCRCTRCVQKYWCTISGRQYTGIKAFGRYHQSGRTIAFFSLYHTKIWGKQSKLPRMTTNNKMSATPPFILCVTSVNKNKPSFLRSPLCVAVHPSSRQIFRVVCGYFFPK